jgi:hypothetical protein
LRESFGRTFVGKADPTGSRASTSLRGSGGGGGGGGGLFGSLRGPRKSPSERLKDAAALRMSQERRDQRVKLRRRVEEFPQVKLARALAESRQLLGHGAGFGIGGATGLVAGPELVSAATGEGVHDAFSRLVVAIQRRRHAAQFSHFRPAGVSLGRPGGAAGADGLTAATLEGVTLGDSTAEGGGGGAPAAPADSAAEEEPAAKLKQRSVFSRTATPSTSAWSAAASK